MAAANRRFVCSNPPENSSRHHACYTGFGELVAAHQFASWPEQSWTRHRRIVGLAGLLGLLSVAGSFYWYTYDLYSHSYWGLVRPSSVAYAFYVGRRVLSGATIAMFVFAIFPKGAKVMLTISVTPFLYPSSLRSSTTATGDWRLL